MNNCFLKVIIAFLLGILLTSIIFTKRINAIYDTLGKFDKRMDCIFDRIEHVIQYKTKKV